MGTRRPLPWRRTVAATAAAAALAGCGGAGHPRAEDQPMTNLGQPGATGACQTVCSLPMDDAALRKLLSPEQYRIVRQNGTEMPFRNAYWDNKKPGIYVDVVSGKPLFSSKTKFDSGTGWPSFTQPIDTAEIVEKTDSTLGIKRVEVRSKAADSHLGHVFEDGPAPTGLRYCINSASLKFIPAEDLEKSGYGEYRKLFEDADK